MFLPPVTQKVQHFMCIKEASTRFYAKVGLDILVICKRNQKCLRKLLILVTYTLLYHNVKQFVLKFIFHYLMYFSFPCLSNLQMSCRIYNQQSVLICLWDKDELLRLFVSVKLSHKPCRGNPNWNIQINFCFKLTRI